MTSEISSKTIMTPNNEILILGNGYIGNYLYETLSKNAYRVSKKSSKDLNYHDSNILYKYCINNNIDTVINCSGFTGRPNIDEAESKKDLCWELNVDSPLRVNKICKDLKINYIHVSSGCIYDGYEKNWDENDSPNFGLFSRSSSFYSITKHAFELLSKDLNGVILRIRMPFGPDPSHRNYLHKIRKYDNLVQFLNSKTYIPDLCEFVQHLLTKKGEKFWGSGREIYNIVNSEPLHTDEVCEIMKKYGFHNDHWNFVTLDKLPIITGRSNCVLNGNKSENIYKLKTETEALEECFQILTKNSENNKKQWEEYE